jgi:hypothetical protein
VAQLWVKIVPLRAGTADAAGKSELLACPPDVKPDTILSFLEGWFGEPVDVAWTSTDRHQRIATGWIFGARPAGQPEGPVELLCMPFIETGDGALGSMFELLADQRQDMEALARSGALDELTVIELPQRDYQAAVREAADDRRL